MCLSCQKNRPLQNCSTVCDKVYKQIHAYVILFDLWLSMEFYKFLNITHTWSALLLFHHIHTLLKSTCIYTVHDLLLMGIDDNSTCFNVLMFFQETSTCSRSHIIEWFVLIFYVMCNIIPQQKNAKDVGNHCKTKYIVLSNNKPFLVQRTVNSWMMFSHWKHALIHMWKICIYTVILMCY